jgi:hypothetical protein
MPAARIDRAVPGSLRGPGRDRGRAAAINEGAGVAHNLVLLVNLTRASRSAPLYFRALTRITGSATADLKLGLPAATLGPGAPTARSYTLGGGITNIVDSSTVTSFDDNLLESNDFNEGMLAPLNLQDGDLPPHQGFARELIFDLVIEMASITPQNGEPFVVDNDPRANRRLGQFQGNIREAMLHGLTTQTFQAPDAPADGGDMGPKPRLSAARRALLGSRPGGAQGARRLSQDRQPLPRSAAPAVRASAEVSDLSVNVHGQPMQIDVTIRSTFGIFANLGSMIVGGDADRMRLYAYPELPAEMTQDARKLTVNHGDAGDHECYVDIGDGERYRVLLQAQTTPRRSSTSRTRCWRYTPHLATCQRPGRCASRPEALVSECHRLGSANVSVADIDRVGAVGAGGLEAVVAVVLAVVDLVGPRLSHSDCFWPHQVVIIAFTLAGGPGEDVKDRVA